MTNSTSVVPDSVRTLETWGVTMVAITALVCIPVAGVGIIPFVSRRTYQRIMVFFVALGVGSLTGNSVFHLVPHAYGIDMENNPHLLLRSWMILFGVYMFFCVDKIVAFVHVYKQMLRNKKETTVSKTNGHSIELQSLTTPPTRPVTTQDSVHSYHTATDDDFTNRIVGGLDVEQDSDAEDADEGAPPQVVRSSLDGHGHSHGVPPKLKGKKAVIGTVAWMIIFGDGLHRLIDGLSVGVMMSDSILSGISITLAILCEEVPHVLGDLAILVNAGMSLREALVYNMLSNIFCYMGAAIGIVAGEMESLANFVFAAAAGMFLYVALASMIPEMNKTMSRKMEKHWRSGLVVGALQLAGIGTGLMIIFLMAKFGTAIRLD